MLLGTRRTGKQGWVTSRYTLCHEDHENKRDLPRKLKAKFVINNEKIELDIGLRTEQFRTDPPEQNGLPGEYSTWERGMRGLWLLDTLTKWNDHGHVLACLNGVEEVVSALWENLPTKDGQPAPPVLCLVSLAH
jgi:hypothetical protein